MALSNAEKVKRYRERQKEKKKEDMLKPEQKSNVFRKPFFEYFPVDQQISDAYCQSLELAGMEAVLFEDDTGPEVSTLDDMSVEDAAQVFGALHGNSLGKAEVIIACLLDAASDLAFRVSDYKKVEITARIAELEQADLSDLDSRRKAIQEISELQAMLAELEKSIRITFPQWKVGTQSK